MNFKVAIVQKRSIHNHISENVSDVIRMMEEASVNAADILLLPECYVTGFGFPVVYENSIAEDDLAIEKVCDAAKKI